MGREVHRVPLDFDWPLNKVWSGFLSPHHFPTCADCDGTGYSPHAQAIADTFYPHQIGGRDAERLAWHDKIGQAEVDHLIAEGRLHRRRDGAWVNEPLTAAEVNAANGPGRQLFGGMTHDAINRHILIGFRCERLGIELLCPHCTGKGYLATDAEEEIAEAWQRIEPPTGDGWQLWETVSEGSPISTVFDTPEGLAHWMSTDYHWGASSNWDYDAALRWITGPAWAPTFIIAERGPS